MARFEALLIRGIHVLIVACLAIMLVMVFGNVVLRYAFNSGISTSEEASRILFVWMTFLGAIVAMRDHSHLGVDSFVVKIPPAIRRWVQLGVTLVMLYACWLLGQGSWQQTIINLGTEAPVTHIPMAGFYATGLVGAVGIAAYLLRDAWCLVSGRPLDHVVKSDAEPDDGRTTR